MDESKKRQPPIDRLSALPDGIICNILSLLPTITSVSTSVLARRWRNLWAHVPVLYFAEIDFRRASSRSEVVNDAVNDVLFAHKSPTIDTFRIYLSDMCDYDDFEDWMVTVVARKVRNLDVFLETSLPQFIFSCETLVDLGLGSCDIPDSGDVSLPALRKLKLELVCYESYNSLPNLLSGCPVLEELDIDMGYSENHSTDCGVASHTLKRLSISCGGTEDHDVSEDYIFEAHPCESMLDTPALRFLHLYHVSPPEVTARALVSLTEAKVDFDLGLQRGPSSRSVLEFLGKLSGVRSLTLTTGFMNITISEFSILNVKFPNLTKLVLEEAHGGFVSVFLENADNLEVLAVRLLYQFQEDLNYWVEPKQVPICLISHLKYVGIYGFEGVEPELNMTKYLLRNSKVLKSLDIQPRSDQPRLKGKFEELNKVLLERGADASKINLH
ncbi:Putative F-box/FBD/LRR-repeat protein [Striga hermonthica]|uniref:F-box/FBD/LRR-repeat protein n=1 Tax=Striga hermonthica TaxID=68872 RepID=A0A9N7MV91_STRHE|nr:Putative F-box/FBD/LRR-repeat protein [Striga hermonthica]